MTRINIQKDKFAKAIVKGKTAKDSAIEAGYSIKTARAIGSRLTKDIEVINIINKEKKKIDDKFGISMEQKLEVIWKMVTDTCIDPDHMEIALKGIIEMNKMQGHLAPEKSVSLNVNDAEMLKDLREIQKLYEKEY